MSITMPPLATIYQWFGAISSTDMPTLELLHSAGLPIDVPHPLRQSTALMEATRLGRPALVHWLLERGAAPAFLGGLPVATALHCALRLRHWEIAAALAEATAEANLVDAYRCTALHILCQEAGTDRNMEAACQITQTLIDKGCPLDAVDQDGATALHHCVINDGIELVQLLLASGANPNPLIPHTAVTPLAIAALEKNLPMATLLLRYGANPHLKIHNGASPASIYPGIARLADSHAG